MLTCNPWESMTTMFGDSTLARAFAVLFLILLVTSTTLALPRVIYWIQFRARDIGRSVWPFSPSAAYDADKHVTAAEKQRGIRGGGAPRPNSSELARLTSNRM
jgi:hypothetical protein